jgi:hypothetical protein
MDEHKIKDRESLKTRFFKADKIFKPEFTIVNEDLKIEVERRKTEFLEIPN